MSDEYSPERHALNLLVGNWLTISAFFLIHKNSTILSYLIIVNDDNPIFHLNPKKDDVLYHQSLLSYVHINSESFATV